MATRNFRRAEPPRKFISCSCGGNAKLTKRRNFPHGSKSDPVTSRLYKCSSCKKETPINNKQEVKR